MLKNIYKQQQKYFPSQFLVFIEFVSQTVIQNSNAYGNFRLLSGNSAM